MALISICTAMFRESYHGIIRRGYLEEFKGVVIHVSIVEIALIAITFFMKDLYYSREVFTFFWPVGLIWIKRLLRGYGRMQNSVCPEMICCLPDGWDLASFLKLKNNGNHT